MSWDPMDADEAAINVIYNLDTDEPDATEWDVLRSSSDPTVDTPGSGGYNLRPARSYSVRRQPHEEDQSHDTRYQASRAGRKRTPYVLLSRSPSAPVAEAAASRPKTRAISVKGKERADPPSINGSSPSSSAAGTKEPAPVIYILSDSSDEDADEDDGVAPEQKSPVRAYKVARTRSPTPARPREGTVSEPESVAPKKSHQAKNPWYKPSDNRTIQPAPRGGQPPKPPDALIDGLRAMREDYRRDDYTLGYRKLPDGQLKWGIRCQSCPDAPLLSGRNAGLTIHNFKLHLDSPRTHRRHPRTPGRKRRKLSPVDGDERARDRPALLPVVDVPMHAGRTSSSKPRSTITPAIERPPRSTASSSTTLVGPSRPAPSSSASEPSTASPAQDDARDPVEDFLRSVGLSADLANTLRSVGVSDRARMRALGGLPDVELDKVDQYLARAGLDAMARILVRCGLRRCAAAEG